MTVRYFPISSDSQLESPPLSPARGPGRAAVARGAKQSADATALQGSPASARARPQRERGRERSEGPRIAALSACHARSTYSQAQVLARLGLSGNEFAEGIYARCGVRRRALDLSEEHLESTLQGRTERIEQQLLAESIRAIDALGCDLDDVGTVISASLYSLGCPTLAHRLVDHYGMHPATDKYHVTGVGCASAVPLIRLAAQTMAAQPGRHALVVAAESMSGVLTRAAPDHSKAQIVASAIFGDGCAAALLCPEDSARGPQVVASQVHQIDASLDSVSLRFGAHDSYLHLERELPDLAGAGLPAVVDSFLGARGIARSAIDHWIVHPGGRRVIEHIRDALGLSDDDVDASWRALAENGNVGTPAIFYVLEDTIERGRPEPGERGLVVTIGPGVTVGLMLLDW